MPLLHSEIARREDARVRVRNEPIRLRWTLANLVSSDGHQIDALFTCSVRALSADADLRMLEEVFMTDRQTVSPDAVVAHFQNALRSAAANACQGKSAADLLAASGNASIVDVIRTAANRVAFACGMEVLAPFQLELQSPTFERQRVEAMQRSLAEQRAAGQIEHFNRAAELLKQFQSIRQNSPDLSAGDVLKQMGPADQGLVLQTLLLASAKEKTTDALWAVAGPNLVQINPSKPAAKPALIPLPAALGPLRSVQPMGNHLLVGARSGIFQIETANPSGAIAFTDSSITSQLGFSRAVEWNGQIFGCHSEAGIVGWAPDQPASPAFALRPADLMGAAPKNLQVLDQSRLIFSAGNRLFLLSRGTDENPRPTISPVSTDAPAEIIATLPDRGRIILALRDGTVQIRDHHSLEVLSQEKPCGPISAAALLPWLGSTRLLLATEQGPVLCLGLDDGVLTQYQSPYPSLRALAAAADVIVAISSDRQRILWWKTWEPKSPSADLFITATTKHRAADVDVSG